MFDIVSKVISIYYVIFITRFLFAYVFLKRIKILEKRKEKKRKKALVKDKFSWYVTDITFYRIKLQK